FPVCVIPCVGQRHYSQPVHRLRLGRGLRGGGEHRGVSPRRSFCVVAERLIRQLVMSLRKHLRRRLPRHQHPLALRLGGGQGRDGGGHKVRRNQALVPHLPVLQN